MENLNDYLWGAFSILTWLTGFVIGRVTKTFWYWQKNKNRHPNANDGYWFVKKEGKWLAFTKHSISKAFTIAARNEEDWPKR